jgi:ATP-dependent Clp protease ATP-binding subunit ClpB
MEEKVMATVQSRFKPEFLNRVDEIIVFHRLARAHLERIVDLQVATVAERLEERRISLVVTESARRYLAERGYDAAYGARPLKRLIQREIANELALKLLDGTFADGDAIEVDAVGDGLVFRKAVAAAAA